MKKTMIDIREMSDSKEVYGRRPNPFIPAFVYSILLLLAAAFLYSCFGKIEIVATASGVIRPNDDVSTVSSLISGRVTSVRYADGQIVQEGDALLSVDMSDTQILINSIRQSREKLLEQKKMLETFLDGLQEGENPFSSDPKSPEYAYYIQFQEYMLSLQSSQKSIDYDVSKNGSSIQSLQEQIAALQYQIDGLNAYKESIYRGENLAGEYPEYANMFTLYTASIDALYNEYIAQYQNTVNQSVNNNDYYLELYQKQLADYTNLIGLIESGAETCSGEKNGIGYLLFEDYKNTMAEYKRKYQAARETYEYYLNGGAVGENEEALLAYSKTMLEGYQLFLQSVTNDQDMFDPLKDSAFYRSLYVDYANQYEQLKEKTATAKELYDAQAVILASLREELSAWEALAQEPEASEETKNTYASLQEQETVAEKTLSEYEATVVSAQAEYNAFRSDTLLAIKNTITKLEAEIAEKEVSLGKPSNDYNVSTAKSNMDSAYAVMETYRNSKLLEYRQIRTELENKIKELRLSAESSPDVNTVLEALNHNYDNAVSQKKLQTISQIDSSIQSLQSQLLSARSSIRVYQISAGLYAKNVDENGTPLPVLQATMEQTMTVVNQLDQIDTQILELDTRLEQQEEQLNQGTIRAERSGIVNAATTVVTGDIISSGTLIATIIPVNESEFKTQIYVQSADMGNIKPGDEIKYSITALPSNQYGTVSGKVLSISQDALIQEGQYSGYFLIEGSIEGTELVDRDGNVGRITIGMQTEARIVTQRKTILRYLLEKMNVV